jgi:signal transduction histidine kinase
MQRFAISVLERDFLGEYLLDEAVRKIESDPFIQLSMSNPLLAKHSVRDKIRGNYLGNYFDRYHVRIALYKTDGIPADNLTATDLVSAIKSYTGDANKTQYPNVYFIHGNQPQSSTQYVAIVNLSPSAGFIIVELTLKRVIPRQTMPDLVIDNRFTQSFRPGDFGFAFYKNNALLSSYGYYNFKYTLDSSFAQLKSGSKVIYSDKYAFVSTSDEGGSSVVVVSTVYPFFMVLANFSFFLVTGIVIVINLVVFLFLKEFQRTKQLSYTVRIQSFAYLAIILPLIAVSFIALQMINQTDEAQLVETNWRHGQLISEGLSGLWGSEADSVSESSLRNYLTEVARTSSFDLSVFDRDGKLMATSSPEIVESGLISNLVNRVAWEKLMQEGSNTLQVAGKIGKLSYSSFFFLIRSELSGRVVGVLELPFFRADEALNKSKVQVMANILVIFASMFILFTLVAIVSIDSFTWPFRLMAKTLRSTHIGGNKPLKWESNDEVGLMVKEYNQMVINLEKSKQALERGQRESAWREIAQQVAHEIKNPLTPIKLTLQQMEKSIPSGLEPEKIERSIKSLLAQVDNLTEIATAFSSFAKLPSPEIKIVDLSSVIKEVVSLYKMHPHRKVEVVDNLNVQVEADPKLLSGVFSNIILNAFQSKSESEVVSVFIRLALIESTCVLSFQDNGSGISDELKEKIFIPHFSTKDSGSGLGLAISKQAIESMGGRIWFESKAGVGTTFFVELHCR